MINNSFTADEKVSIDIVVASCLAEKGTALVDFVLWSPVQTIHQKFGFCREDGSWRIHNIIRYFSDADGKEEETDIMEAMTSYLAEPLEEVSEMTQ